VGWLTPKMAPATSWVRFVHISAATIATDRYSPIAAGPPGCRHLADESHDTRGQLAQLPARQPRNSLVPQRLLLLASRYVTARDSTARAVLISTVIRGKT